MDRVAKQSTALPSPTTARREVSIWREYHVRAIRYGTVRYGTARERLGEMRAVNLGRRSFALCAGAIEKTRLLDDVATGANA
jgi:hypothetical protein